MIYGAADTSNDMDDQVVAAVPYCLFAFISNADKKLLISTVLPDCSEMQSERLAGRRQQREAGPQVYPILTPVSF